MTKRGQHRRPFNGEAPPQRLLSPNGRGMSCFAGCLLAAVVAVLLIGCMTIANRLPSGPGVSIPPDHVVVFGRIEVKSDLTCSYYWQPEDLHLCQKYFKIPWLEDLRGKEGTLEITFVDIPFKSSGLHLKDKSWGYLFRKLKSPEFTYRLLFDSDDYWIDCPGGFPVPQDASAVYVGTIVVKISESPDGSRPAPWHSSRGGHITLSIEDEYDEAVRLLRGRNLDFHDRIVKSLFRDFGWSGFSESALRNVECRFDKYSRFFIIPLI